MLPGPDEVPGITPPDLVSVSLMNDGEDVSDADDIQSSSAPLSANTGNSEEAREQQYSGLDDPSNPNADSIVYKDTTPVDAGKDNI